jgi:phenylacetyl-CoA:acceptor oxidoreductase subunit 2
MELIRPQKQKVWQWPAVINFSCGGLGAGLYVLGAVMMALQPVSAGHVAVLKLAGPVLASLGFLALTTEAGRPARGINLFRHLRRSWMSRETLAAAVFIPFALLDWLLPHPIWQGIAIISAIALMFCQGMIVYRSRGVTAWNVSLMPWWFMASGWASGFGLLLAASAVTGDTPHTNVILVGVFGVALNFVMWVYYVRLPNAAFQAATQALRQSQAMTMNVVIGQLAPLVGVGALTSLTFDDLLTRASLFIVGAVIVLGNVHQKAGLILEAGYLRAIVLSMPRPPASAQPKTL